MLSDDRSIVTDIVKTLEYKILECSENAEKMSKDAKVNKNWLDKTMTSKVTLSLRKFRFSKSLLNLNEYISLKSSYKSLCSSKKRKHNELMVRKLVNAFSQQKVFWIILKYMSGSNRDTPSDISTHSWYEHFNELLNPRLNTEEIEEEVTEQDIQMNSDIEAYILIMDIVDEEILDAIKSLKANKATSGILSANHFNMVQTLLFHSFEGFLTKYILLVYSPNIGRRRA